MPGGLLRQTHSPKPKDRNLIADNSRQTGRADLSDMMSASHGACSTDTLIGVSRTVGLMARPRCVVRPARPGRYANAVFTDGQRTLVLK